MQEVRDKGEWDSTRVQLTGIGEATIIFKWTGREWEPVLMSAQSAALLSKGINELGLYTLVPLRAPRETRFSTQPGSRIGRYGGTIVARGGRHTAGREAVERLARQGKRYLREMRSNEHGWVVVDGEGGPLPLMHLANDARGAEGQANVRFTEQGVGVAMRNVPGADLMAAKGVGDIAPSELLTSYGTAFWRVHQTLGQVDNPVLVEAHVA